MMKTDRDLLELAAKAAGYTITAWVEDANGVDRFQVYSDKSMWLEWNPLADDGDALRLAVNLGINIYLADLSTILAGRAGMHGCRELRDDDFSATRRAIVRAAAAIGEAMQ